jgi:hypothetical protein
MRTYLPADYDAVYEFLNGLNERYEKITPASSLILGRVELHKATKACLTLGVTSPEQITEGLLLWNLREFRSFCILWRRHQRQKKREAELVKRQQKG